MKLVRSQAGCLTHHINTNYTFQCPRRRPCDDFGNKIESVRPSSQKFFAITEKVQFSAGYGSLRISADT